MVSWTSIHLSRSKEILEPVHWILGISLEAVLVIHIIKTKPRRKSSCPFPVIHQRPHKVSFHVATIFSAYSAKYNWMISFHSERWINTSRDVKNLLVPFCITYLIEAKRLVRYSLWYLILFVSLRASCLDISALFESSIPVTVTSKGLLFHDNQQKGNDIKCHFELQHRLKIKWNDMV